MKGKVVLGVCVAFVLVVLLLLPVRIVFGLAVMYAKEEEIKG